MSSQERHNQERNSSATEHLLTQTISAITSTADTSPAVEMAYLLLDDCYSSILLLQSSSSPSSSSGRNYQHSSAKRLDTSPSLHKWIPVHILPRSIEEPRASSNPTQQRRHPAPQKDQDRKFDDVTCCCRCHLVVTQNNETNEFSIDMNHVVPYNGTVDDIKCCGDGCCTQLAGSGDRGNHHSLLSSGTSTNAGYEQRTQQRSDAALLMGLFAACDPHVHIVRCFMMLSHRRAIPNYDSADVNKNDYYGSILVTLAFPTIHLTKSVDVDDMNGPISRRSIVADTTALTMNKMNSISLRRNSSNSFQTKPLYPALQLLLTLIRSDWDQYEVRKELLVSLSQNPTSRRQIASVSFFPPSLTLSNMYQRIQQQHQNYIPTQQPHVDPNNSSMLSDSLSYLTSLPFDILQRKVVQPYFDASTLASLRSTCRYMYHSLRSIVPGLNLQLYNHQVNSLQWMRQRETSRIRNESDCFDDDLNTSSIYNETSDIHRAITGGASVKLCTNPLANLSHPLCNERQHEVIYIDPYTGLEILPNDIKKLLELRRNVACGGLLCDDPGLGKTITVLALILQTPMQHCSVISDQSTHESIVNESSNQTDDEKLFELYWSEEISPDYREPYLLKLINDFCKKASSVVGTSFPINEFRKSIGEDSYGSNFGHFDVAVQNTILNCETNVCIDASSSSMSTWKEMVQDFKRVQMNSVRKCFANAKAKPNSRVAALVEEESRKMHLKALLPTSGTLIVVPSVLLEHWKAQINQHIDFRYLTDKKPLIFEFQRRDTAMTYDRATILCRMNRTHTPLVFIDSGGTRPLPPAEFLAMFQIVITTTQRFVNEAKKGSFQEELERDHKHNTISASCFDDGENTVCQLLKVHWMRMVVDEGHSMANDGHNSSITFASWIKAYRRWAMTGTPTKQNATQLGQVRGLMRFLQHEFFSSRLSGDVLWKSRVAKGWKNGDMASFFRLQNLLRYLMRRHTKLNIEELPPPLFFHSKVETSFVEANTYNTLVSAVQMNLLLTSMNGKTSGFQDSLLHRAQAKSARLVLQNIRRVCTGWSRVVPTLSFRHFAETVEMAKLLKHSEEAVTKIKLFMTRAEQEDLSTCSCCAIQISTMLLMSCCGGQICTECMDSTTNTCYLCDNQFDVDELQKFQPGFVLDWRSNLKFAEPLKDLPNAAPPMVPAIERVIRPPQARRRTKKPGDGHKCDFDMYATDGRCIHCLEEHNFCCLFNDRWRCDVCYRTSEACPMDESKSHFLSCRLLELHKEHTSGSSRPDDSTHPYNFARPLKVIVFSQFRAALNFVGDRLLRKFGNACVAEFFGSHRKQELHKFTYEDCCFCLLLTKDGSEGLDLSFVTNVIFLEEVYDKSLIDQVVARAWRMGANGRVTIETLIAKNTIEEVLGEQIKIPDEATENNMYAKNSDQQRQSLLQSLRFITDHQSPFQKTSLSIMQNIESRASETGFLKRSLSNTNPDETVDQQPKRERRTVRFAFTD